MKRSINKILLLIMISVFTFVSFAMCDMSVKNNKLNITEDGKLGIGTSAPTEKLEIKGGSIKTDYGISASTGSIILMTVSTMTASSMTVTNLYTSTGTFNQIYVSTISPRSPLTINNGANNVNITGTGNVGIGTTSPSGLFQVGAGTLTVLSNGYVGIGTTIPTSYIDVNAGSTNNVALYLHSTGGGWGSGMQFGGVRKFGMYSSALGTLNITDEDAIAYRLVIDSIGRIGIGTASPAQKLHLYNNGSINFRMDSGEINQDNLIYLRRGPLSSIGTLIGLTAGNTFDLWTQEMIGLRFGTSDALRMYISRYGNVGIGTDNPTGLFQVGGGSLTVLSSGNVGIGTTSPIGLFQVGGGALTALSSGNVGIGTTSPTGLFQVGGGSLTVLSGGNVGIGTTSPNSKLDIKTTGEALRLTGGASQAYMAFNNGSTRVGYIGTYTSGNDIVLNADSTNGIYLQTGGNPRMYINSSGYVGIGTNGPQSMLDVNGSEYLRGSLVWQSGTKYWHSMISGNDLDFVETGVADGRLYLKAGGNIGIGTTNPQYPLDVVGTASYVYADFGRFRKDAVYYAGYVTGNSASYTYSIRANGCIVASEFHAVSDKRIKTNIKERDTAEDLKLINNLKDVNYNYIDVIEKGNRRRTGFIAQEVEKILPDAVNKISGIIPDIYVMSIKVKYNEKESSLIITLDKEHNLKVGDNVRLVTKDKMNEYKVTGIINEKEFKVEGFTKPVDEVFVYGKKIDDFRNLDYDYIFSVGIGAIKELDAQMKQKDEDIKKLRDEKDAQIKNLEDRLKILEKKVLSSK
jgi:hypothetical protein